MADFKKWYDKAQKWEGFYSNNPNDNGGETYKGIARNYNPDWPGWKIIDAEKARRGGKLMNNFNLKNAALDAEVEKVAKRNYWNPIRGNEIKNQAVAEILADALWGGGGVNLIRRMQNLLKVAPDGKIGSITLAAMNSANSAVLFEKLKEWRKGYFITASKKGNNATFLNGWLNRLRDFNYIPDNPAGIGFLIVAVFVVYLFKK